jgi:hypothetical protein
LLGQELEALILLVESLLELLHLPLGLEDLAEQSRLASANSLDMPHMVQIIGMFEIVIVRQLALGLIVPDIVSVIVQVATALLGADLDDAGGRAWVLDNFALPWGVEQRLILSRIVKLGDLFNSVKAIIILYKKILNSI